MNNKIVSVVLVAGIAATGFAGISAANESGKTSFFKGNGEVKELYEKVKSGAELTAEEQALLDQAKAKKSEKGAKHGGKRKGGGNLTDEEKATLETLSDEEKKEFFAAKKEEMNAQKEAKKELIDALIAGETLSSEQETLRAEVLTKLEGTDSKYGEKEGAGVILKLLNGESLSEEDEAAIAEMQAKKAEKEEQKAILAPIKEKLEAGEELTEQEQTLLDEAKASKNKGNKGEKKGERNGERAHKGE